MRNNNITDDAAWIGHFSEPDIIEPGSGQQLDHNERCIFPQDLENHADHSHYRYAARDRLHIDHLLDIPREGKTDFDKLLVWLDFISVTSFQRQVVKNAKSSSFSLHTLKRELWLPACNMYK